MQMDLTSWDAYLASRKASLDVAWQGIKFAYKNLKQVRADLHMPFIDASESGWTTELDQDSVDLQYATLLLLSAGDDVLSGRRKIAWDDSKQDFFIEKQPTDKLVIVSVQNRFALALADTGALTHVNGTLSGLELGAEKPLAYFNDYILLERECYRLKTIAEEKTRKSLGVYQQMLLADTAIGNSTVLARAISDSTSSGLASIPEEKTTVIENKTVVNSGLSAGEKILLASVIVSTIGLLTKLWSQMNGKSKD